MLTGVHFLLTYTCTFECDHCFLHCSPRSEGTFTLGQLRQALDEISRIDSVSWVFFEGGEAFMFYPLMVEGVRMARERDLKVGIVTNAYWAFGEEDAELWLRPLLDIGIDDLSLSDDTFHQGEGQLNTARIAFAAAQKMGFPARSVCISEPTVTGGAVDGSGKGEPIVGGDVMLRGRAVDKLVEGLPRRPWQRFTECPHEDLRNLSRVHVDSYGHVHLCQGLSMGNMWETPLSKLVEQYRYPENPICGPLVDGGPANLARKYNVPCEDGYVDACHMCYSIRRALLDRFPEYLVPRQVYGLE